MVRNGIHRQKNIKKSKENFIKKYGYENHMQHPKYREMFKGKTPLSGKVELRIIGLKERRVNIRIGEKRFLAGINTDVNVVERSREKSISK